VVVVPAEHARLLAEIRDALQGAEPASLAARLEQVQATLDRIEARLAELERELAGLLAPSWPF
jgi:hypothetical protein